MNARLWKSWFLYMGKLLAIIATASLLVVILLSATGIRNVCCRPTAVPADRKIKVSATFFPIYDIASKIGGDKVRVVLILPTGASPHTFELTPEKIKEIQGSSVVFKIGGIDDWIDVVADSIPGAEKVVLRKGIAIKDYPVPAIGDPETETGGDPHYWMTMKNGKIIAKNIADRFSELDPGNSSYYEANLADFDRSADDADRNIRSILSGAEGRSIVAFHNAWNYFAEEYGIKVAASFEPSPGKEPFPAHLMALAELVKKEGIKVIFSEPAFSDDLIRSFMTDLGLKLYILHPEDAAWESASYIDTMIFNAKTIAQALSEN